jgi:uncharacterized protein YqgV (UPF0045/DUF77 family)
MTSTIEISLYPLNNEYPSAVLRFLEKLKEIEGLEIRTNGMSTILIGDFDLLWNSLGHIIEWQHTREEAVCVVKVAPGRREYVE